MYIKSIQYDGKYNFEDFEIIIQAIDEVKEYSIRFMHHKYPKFIKFINKNPDFISKKIDEKHWIYKILKDNIIDANYQRNPLLVPLGLYDYENSYEDFEYIKNIEKMKKEIVNTIPGITISQSHSLDEFVAEEKVVRAASEAFIKTNKGVIDRINKECEPKRRKIYI